MTSGFSAPEADFSWMSAARGVIDLVLPERISRFDAYELVLSGSGRRSILTGEEQRCTVALNGKLISYVRVPEHYSDIAIPIPSDLMGKDRSCHFELIPEHSEMVFGDGDEIVDSRNLSFRLTAITVVTRNSIVPVFVPGTIYDCTLGGRGAEALVSGFHTPEHEFTWIAGIQGEMRFALMSQPSDAALRLDLVGRTSLASKKLQSVRVTVNDRVVGDYELESERQTVIIKLRPADISGASLWVTLAANHAEAVFDESHSIVDGRMLGVAVAAIGVLDGLDGAASATADALHGKGTKPAGDDEK